MFSKKLFGFSILLILLYLVFPYLKNFISYIVELFDFYRFEISIFFILPLTIILIFYKLLNSSYSNNDKKSDLFDDDEDKDFDKDKITGIKKIIESHNNDNFFSLALMGGWGTGKSSFLKKLKIEIEKEKGDFVIYLNVWELENIQNILEETKKEFDDIVFKLNKIEWLFYHMKSIFLNNYFSMLSKYFSENNIKFNLPFSNTIKDSKDEYNELLKKVLKNKKIVFMLDELDRLESKNDIINIFKIIRYITSFNKVFAITAVDINKLKDKLELDYIHKIFSAKYIIPKNTKNELLSFLKEQISEKSSEFITKEDFNLYLRNNSNLINFITTYREIKNIYNDTYILCKSLKNGKVANWQDFITFEFIFSLNLLKTVNIELFTKFINEDAKLQELIMNPQKKDLLDKNPQKDKINEYLENNVLRELSFKFFTSKNIEQSIYIYTHQCIYDYMFTENDYKNFLLNSSLLINKLNEIKNSEKPSKFIDFLINRLYKEENKNILTLSKILLENDLESYYSADLILKLLKLDSFSKDIKELIMYCFEELNHLNKEIFLKDIIYSIDNGDDKIYKLIYDSIDNKYKNHFKELLITRNIYLDYKESIVKFIELIKNIIGEDFYTFFEDNQSYTIYMDVFIYKTITGKEIKEIIENILNKK